MGQGEGTPLNGHPSTADTCILLAEMLTNELPEKKDRECQICQILKIAVEHPNFNGFVRHCLSIEHKQRPAAQAPIVQLSDL